MKKWGINYEVLRKINPKLIYAAISGFGQTGIEKYRKKTAFDVIAQAVGGFIHACNIEGAPKVPMADKRHELEQY